MVCHRRVLYMFLLVYLVTIVSGWVSYEQFRKENKKGMNLCADFTTSNELQLSYACAQRLELSRPGTTGHLDGRFMADLQRVNRKLNGGQSLYRY